MNKRIKKKISKRKQNEEPAEWVKAFIGSRMAGAVLNGLLGANEQTPETIAHDYMIKIQRADWTRSMYNQESDAYNYIFRKNIKKGV